MRNGVALGLGNIISFVSGYGRDEDLRTLITESSDNLVQENDSLILA